MNLTTDEVKQYWRDYCTRHKVPAELLALVRDAADRAPPGPARWASVVRALMPAYRRARVFHAALINDVKFLPAEERGISVAQQRAVVDAIAAVLNEAFPDRIPPARLKPVTMALLGMLNFSFAWLRPDGPMSHEEFGELALSLSLHGLAGAPP